MERFHIVNQEFVPAAEARIHVSDIGFRRGFSAFDFLRIVRGRALFLEDHLDRFDNSCRILGLELPVGRDRFRELLLELVARNRQQQAGIQMYLTGGCAEDGYTPATPNLVVLQNPSQALPRERYRSGAALITHRYQRELPEAKTTNYLMAIWLGTRIRDAGAIDVLYHDGRRALETARSNLFVVARDGTIVTPGRDVLAGVTRKNVIRALGGELRLEERDVALEELAAAREVFITSTTKGALPVTRIDGRPVGAGVPGEVTREVARRFAAYLEAHLEAVPG